MGGEQALRTVIGILRDGELGYRDFAGALKDTDTRAFFLEESRVRSVFAAELERLLQGTDGAERLSRGTSLGTLHRSWVDLRLAMGASDRTILETTERCEEYALTGYESSMKENELQEETRSVLQRQARHVRQVLDVVRGYLVNSDRGHSHDAGGAWSGRDGRGDGSDAQ